MRSLLRWWLGIFLISPYLVWLMQIQKWSWPVAAEWRPALFTAFGQAFLSATISLGTGGLLFLSLQSWSIGRARTWLEFALLLPNMVPPLFVALGLLNLVTVWVSFPYGVGAVVVAHVLLNSGLVAMALDRLVHARLGRMAEVSWIMGASPRLFWRRVAWSYLRVDLTCLYLFVFSLSFTSFSLPLLLGGQRAPTLEVVIYDYIRIEGRWDKAVLLAAFQGLMLLALAYLLPHPFWAPKPGRENLKYLAWSRGRWTPLVPALIILTGWITGAARGLSLPWDLPLPLTEALLTTLALALAVGLLHLLMFLLIAYVSPHERLRRFLNGYLSPSPVITGFALLLLPGEGDLVNLFKVSVALTLISLPLLYRWIVHSALAGLSGQIAMARTLGASRGLILFEVVWPEIASSVMRACGLAALWASGDFALTGILAGDVTTMPLLMEDLIANYRMDQAAVLLVPLTVVGLGSYYLFTWAGRYVSR